MVECFLIERTDNAQQEAIVNCGSCETITRWTTEATTLSAADWPDTCVVCDAALDYDAEHTWRGLSGRNEWRRADDHSVTHLNVRSFGPGAMWDAEWMGPKGHDGRCIVVICPDGLEWIIDSRAANCTRKGEDHDCWCRHGEPPRLTVDKQPEPGRSTCAAGAGSIQTGTWHGFLRDGRFQPV